MKYSTFAKLILSAVLAAGASTYASAGNAAVPAGLTQQGRLFETNGDPYTGTIKFTFTIYDAATDGTSLWTEDHNVVMDDGYYSVRLGESGTPLPAGLFDGSVLYLGVKIGTDPEMTPRQRIGSVPYAFVADNVTGDITPKSVSVNSVKVIAEDGTLHGFQSTLKYVDLDIAAGANGASISGTAACPADYVVVGGGCQATAIYRATIKKSYPTAARNGWACTMLPHEENQPTQGSAHAICAPE